MLLNTEKQNISFCFFYFGEMMNLIKKIVKQSGNYKYWSRILGSDLVENVVQNIEYNKILLELLVNETHIKNESEIFNCISSNISDDEKEVFAPIRSMLIKYLNQLQKSKYKSNYLKKETLAQLSKDFVRRLEKIYTRSVLQEMQYLKKIDALPGDSSEEQYENFLKIYLQDSENQRIIVEKYPVMLQLIYEKVHGFVDFISEVLNHLECDKSIIIEKLCNGNDFNYIASFNIGLSDEHITGKTVVKIKLDNGYSIYYKPHYLDTAVNFNKITTWFFQQCGVKYYEHLIVDRGSYGWENEIIFKECLNETEVEQFYFRMGIQLCLSYVLNISDLHFENVIAHGEYPIFIDLEVFPDMHFTQLSKHTGIHKLLEHTVLSTGILPYNIWGNQVSIAALGDGKIQKSPFKVPSIAKKRTSEMYIYYDYSDIPMSDNIPSIDGKRMGVEKYIDFILQGFIRAYKEINSLKENFVQLLAPVFDQKSRYLMRNTQEYTMYQNVLCFPEMMRNSKHRYIALLRMIKGLHCQERYKYQILQYEMHCIYHLCIPVYYAKGQDLYLGNGIVLSGYFQQSIKDIVIQKLNWICDRDLEIQIKFILVSFLTTIKAKSIKLSTFDSYLRASKYFTYKTFAELIISNRIEYDSEMGWVGICYGKKGNTFLAPINMYLYDGVAGIAIFMTALSIYEPCNKYTKFSQWLIQRLFTYSTELIDGLRDLRKCHWGMFTGEASIIYTYILLYRITNEKSYMFYAEKHSQFLIDHLSMVTEIDLLNGKAGIAMVMIFLYEETGGKKYLDAAIQIADELLRLSVPMDQGIGWLINNQKDALSGLAHGNSGIALALAKLWEKTKKTAYYETVLQAIEYENTLFDEGKGNWGDIRGGRACSRDTSGWCHGAPGILISRVEIQKIMKIDAQILFIEQALCKTQNTQSVDACLCHGYTGIHEILSGCGTVNKRALHISGVSIEDFINPGFMTGSSGIGYALLRQCNPLLPNIICFK